MIPVCAKRIVVEPITVRPPQFDLWLLETVPPSLHYIAASVLSLSSSLHLTPFVFVLPPFVLLDASAPSAHIHRVALPLYHTESTCCRL